MNGRTRNVAIVLYQGVEILDFAGPAEVFAAAANEGDDRGNPAFNVYTVATTRDVVVSQGFVDIVPDHAFDGAPAPDIIVIPGGSSSAMLGDSAFMAWAGAEMVRAELTMTVCTGAMAPAVLGLFDGLTVTTHHSALGRLQKLAPNANVEANRRFIDNGRIVTTAGVSAGIDGALHVVARLLGRSVADRTARYMEYDWQPEPTQADGYSFLDPSRDERGRQLQQVLLDAEAGDWSAARDQLESLIAADADDGYAWMLLTEVMRGLEAWPEALAAARRTGQFAGYEAEAKFLEACVLARMDQPDAALGALGAAFDAGFAARWRMDQERDLDGLRSDDQFADLLARSR